VHVLFDESNSLVENNAQDEEFELGLAKKDFSPIHEGGKDSQEGSGIGPVFKAERQGLNKQRELQQNPVWNRTTQTGRNRHQNQCKSRTYNWF